MMGAMKRLLVIACIVLISSGMKKRRYTPEPTPQVTIAPSPKASPSPVPSGRGYLTFAPVDYYSTKAERVKIKAAEIKVNQVIRYSSSEPDFDGLVGSFKHVLDGLVEARVIATDKMSCIGAPTYSWEKVAPKNGRIEITVESL